MKRYICLIFTVVLMESCLKDEDIKLGSVSYQPVQLNDGWKIDTVSSVNFNMSRFNEIINSVCSENENLFVRSLVIVKKGKLLVEAYPKNPNDRDEPHQVWSVTKSFVSILTGIAIDKNYIKNVNDGVFNYLPEYKKYTSGDFLSITIQQCLTMRSGIDYDNDSAEEEDLLAQVPDELTKYIVERPMKTKPGTEAYYKNSDPQLLVKVIENATNTDLVEFAENNLFKPLEINNYFWSRNKDSTPYGGFGLWLRPRDLAKLGQLMLNKGKWNEFQLVSKSWITEATTYKTTVDSFGYGYFFWIDVDRNRYWCLGHGGQYIFIVPEKQMVIVVTSDQFADVSGTTIEEVTELVDKIVAGVN